MATNIENKISVVINTYNAEKFLTKVLEAVKDFDEIVICDMESTDDTLSISKRYDCHIVTFPKKDYVSAEPARTFAIQAASYKWVLVVDADEIVTPELKKYLYEQISRNDCPEGLFIPRRNYFMNTFIHCAYPDYQLRFFIREGTVWPPYVHTFPKVKGRTQKIPLKRNVCFEHLAENSIKDVLTKNNQYTENEVEKKANKNYGLFALVYRPLWRFSKSYLLKGGFRDGYAGFIHACIEGMYQFTIVAKIIERKKNQKNNPD
jgi:glycosyltransferase involved in cell wall biosynthesis